MVSNPDLYYEQELWKHGMELIGGMDEAGRGALAGPVTVGAVILPTDSHLPSTLSGVRDSKQMTPLQRSHWAKIIREVARAWSLGWATAEEIDDIGITAATRFAAERALAALTLVPQSLLTDFRLSPDTDLPITSIIKGDQKSLTIACASILAKTARDALMCDLDAQYPGYELAKHKGYGTLSHRMAIKRLGHSPIHRKTFVIHEK